MATFDVDVPLWQFPEGTTVAAYRDKGHNQDSGIPKGNPTSSATVTNGGLTFSNLTALTWYVAVANVNGEIRQRRFQTDPSTTGGGGGGSEPVDISGKEDKTNKGQASGYASLDATTRVPTAQLARAVPGKIFMDDFCAGDGVTDDTAALQQIIDAVATFNVFRVYEIVAGPKTYLFNSPPRTDREGHAIVALPAVATLSSPTIRFKGVPGQTVFKTTRTDGAYSGSFGSPSLIGGPTIEQTGLVSGSTNLFDWNIQFEDIELSLPTGSTYSGIDLGKYTKCLLRNVSVDAFQTGSLDTAANPNLHTFGVRYPLGLNYGSVNADQVTVAGFYVGQHFSTHLQATRILSKWCVIGFVPEGNGHVSNPDTHGNSIQRMHHEWNNYGLAGWTPTGGAASLPVSTPAWVNIGFLDIEEAPAGHAWALPVQHILDANNQLYGHINYLRAKGNVVAVQNGITPISGGANLALNDLSLAPVTMAASTVPVSGTSYQNTSGRMRTERVRIQLQPQNSGSNALYPVVVASLSPTAYYRLGESSGTTAEENANVHDGTYVNTPTLGDPGIFSGDTAVTFNGTDERADLTTLGSLGSNLLTATFECWVKTAVTTGPKYVFGVTNAASTGMGVAMAINSTNALVQELGSIALWTRGANDQVIAGHGTFTPINDDTWHHVVWIIQGNGNPYRCFVDGVEIGVTMSGGGATQTTGNFTNAMSLAAANLNGTPSGHLAGSLDEVAFYPTRLTTAQVLANYSVGSGAATSALEVSNDNTNWTAYQTLRASPGIANFRSDGFTFPWAPGTFFRVSSSAASHISAVRTESRLG